MHIQPVSDAALEALGIDLIEINKASGFIPNSLRVAARRPPLMRAVGELVSATMGGAELPQQLCTMVGYMASRAAGCTYCQAHTSHGAYEQGVESAKIEKMWEFESCELFDPSERAALRFARDAAQQPNGVREEHYTELREYFSEEQIVDLLGIISLFGFLNRWNDSLATALEDQPKNFASNHLAGSGWEAGKHA